MNFLKYLLATVLGIFLFFIILALVGGMVGSAFASGDKVNVKSNSILVARLADPIGERTLTDPIAKLKGGNEDQMGLYDIIDALNNAKDDGNIEGMLLNLSQVPGQMASLQDLRDAIVNFKTSGKPVVAYSETMSQMAYFLASAADKIYVNPAGMMELKGFSTETMYFKGTLDKLGVQPQVFYAGKFKSATEPFRRYDMSEENRIQVQALIGEFHEAFVREIANSRNLSEAKVNEIINGFQIRSIDDAVELGIIDGSKFYDEVTADLKAMLDKEADDKLNTIGLGSYVKYVDDQGGDYSKNRVAVVFAEGNIVSGDGEETSIGSTKYAKILRKLRKDDKVKAVVLRVNSPGGSALASDVIWREVELLKQEGKPVVTSMGDLAASGGYFIACNSDKIYAEENTITGSIGVFGMFATLDKLFNEKLGITFDRVKSAPYADFMKTVFRPLESEEGAIIQEFIDDIYDSFLSKVSKGRGLDRAVVEEIAQGRVWTGEKAIELGLVDELGGLYAAVNHAAELADLESFKTKEYPLTVDPMMKIMDEFSGKGKPEPAISSLLLKELPQLREFGFLFNNEPYQMLLPYRFTIQ